MLEDTVQQILELILSWLLSISFVFHWSQDDIHGIDLLELTWADYWGSNLSILQGRDDCTDLTFKGAMAVSDRAEGWRASSGVLLDRCSVGSGR